MRERSKPPHSPELDAEGLAAQVELEPTPEELALAQTLADALDGARLTGARARSTETSAAAGLRELLETAAFVATSHQLELAPERKASLRAKLERDLERRSTRRVAPKPRRFRWFLPLPLAAALLFSVFFTQRRGGQSPEAALEATAPSVASVAEQMARPAAETPGAVSARSGAKPSLQQAPPSKELLRAQAEVLAASAASREGADGASNVEATRKRLELELRVYRSQLMASLDDRLGRSPERAFER